MPAFAFAFRDFDGWLLALGRKQDIAHLYIGGSGSKHNVSSRNEVRDIFGPCTRQYASTIASFLHNEVSLDNARLHADT